MSSIKPKPKKTSPMAYLVVLGPVLLLVGYLQFRYNQSRIQSTTNLLPLRAIPCWKCEGKGHMPDTRQPGRTTPCRECYGVGQRVIRIDPATQTVCTGCSGMGHVYDRDLELQVECLVCEGFGAMAKPRDGQIRETIFDPAATGGSNETPSTRFELLRESPVTPAKTE